MPFHTLLADFGTVGAALAVVGSIAWVVWKKIVEPQLKKADEAQERHIVTLNKIIETHELQVTNHNTVYEEHIKIERENVVVLQKLNDKISSHHEQMKNDHENHARDLAEVRRGGK